MSGCLCSVPRHDAVEYLQPAHGVKLQSSHASSLPNMRVASLAPLSPCSAQKNQTDLQELLEEPQNQLRAMVLGSTSSLNTVENESRAAGGGAMRTPRRFNSSSLLNSSRNQPYMKVSQSMTLLALPSKIWRKGVVWVDVSCQRSRGQSMIA